MITTFSRGHKIYYDGKVWRYMDNGEVDNDKRLCLKCNLSPTPEGYDPCLGYVKGATSACCGHGVEEPYIVYR